MCLKPDSMTAEITQIGVANCLKISMLSELQTVITKDCAIMPSNFCLQNVLCWSKVWSLPCHAFSYPHQEVYTYSSISIFGM